MDEIVDEKKVVEEVMRSCGGAVQGIREPFIVTTTNENEDDKAGLYLNRANDGFVFYDHGDYSLGPVNWKNTDMDLFPYSVLSQNFDAYDFSKQMI